MYIYSQIMQVTSFSFTVLQLGPGGHFLHSFPELVLWNCSYVPWDHFIFLADSDFDVVFTSPNALVEEIQFSISLSKHSDPSPSN